MNRRYLNHVGPFVYRPGERELARRVFEILGCSVVSDDQRYLEISVDPDDPEPAKNVLYAWEATPQQMEWEDALASSLSSGGALSAAYHAYRELVWQRAYEWPHFGIRVSDESELMRVLADLTEAGEELRCRLSLVSPILRTDDKRGFETVQAFVYTDVVAVGLVTLGQMIEFQVINTHGSQKANAYQPGRL